MTGFQKACPPIDLGRPYFQPESYIGAFVSHCSISCHPFPSHLCVEPLPNIRDGILVERLVKTMRYVADMRRCQYVVQRPEGVRRRQRLNVEYVDRRAGDLLVLQHADQKLALRRSVRATH